MRLRQAAMARRLPTARRTSLVGTALKGMPARGQAESSQVGSRGLPKEKATGLPRSLLYPVGRSLSRARPASPARVPAAAEEAAAAEAAEPLPRAPEAAGAGAGAAAEAWPRR